MGGALKCPRWQMFAGTLDGNNKTITNYQNHHGSMFYKIVDVGRGRQI